MQRKLLGSQEMEFIVKILDRTQSTIYNQSQSNQLRNCSPEIISIHPILNCYQILITKTVHFTSREAFKIKWPFRRLIKSINVFTLDKNESESKISNQFKKNNLFKSQQNKNLECKV